jgi:RHS repeat-associated protein
MQVKISNSELKPDSTTRVIDTYAFCNKCRFSGTGEWGMTNDHLGTPRYITAGNAQPNVARGQLAGQQAFGPYGEEMRGTFNTSNGQTQALPTGYAPITGYTGHLNEDLTGLIYMKGRYYSPLWHRFINSDQGVDPNSINQYAYVGGRPFMATDPSGMQMWCLFKTIIYGYIDKDGNKVEQFRSIPVLIGGCFDDEDGKGGGNSGQGQQTQQQIKKDCEEYAERLVALASSYRSNYLFGKMAFGKDLFDKAFKGNVASSLGLVTSSKKTPYDESGFNDRLIRDEQRQDVFRHIGGAIGTMAYYGDFGKLLLVGQTLSDLGQYIIKDRDESIAEIHGNIAGALLGPSFDLFFYGLKPDESLKNDIMRILCEK